MRFLRLVAEVSSLGRAAQPTMQDISWISSVWTPKTVAQLNARSKVLASTSWPAWSLLHPQMQLSTRSQPWSSRFQSLSMLMMMIDELGIRLIDATAFGHLAGPEGWVSARNRLLGYESGLAAHGLGSQLTLFGDWTSESGYDASAQFAKSDITAVIAASDQMAFGLLRGLSDQGVSVSADMRVVGFDDLAESRYFRPSLTTLRQDFEAHGQASVKKLLELIETSRTSRNASTQPLELIIRESSGPAPADR